MKQKKFISVLCCLMLGAFIGFISKISPSNISESQKFLEDIAGQFQSSNDPIKLTDVTPFIWDRVCSLGADDSEPEITKKWVAEKLAGQDTPEVSDHAQRAIVFYSEGSPVKALILETAYFNFKNNEYVFMAVNEKGDDVGESCFNVNAAYLNFILTWETGKYAASSITLDDEPFGTVR